MELFKKDMYMSRVKRLAVNVNCWHEFGEHLCLPEILLREFPAQEPAQEPVQELTLFIEEEGGRGKARLVEIDSASDDANEKLLWRTERERRDKHIGLRATCCRRFWKIRRAFLPCLDEMPKLRVMKLEGYVGGQILRTDYENWGVGHEGLMSEDAGSEDAGSEDSGSEDAGSEDGGSEEEAPETGEDSEEADQ